MKNRTIIRISRPINKLYPTEYKEHKDEMIPKFMAYFIKRTLTWTFGKSRPFTIMVKKSF